MASDDVVGAASACQSGQAALAAGLLKRFTAAMATAGGNLVFSPLSIHVALALMSAGAGGKTLDQILAVAGAPSRGELEAFVRDTVVERTLADRSATGGPCVAFACGVWSDKRFPLKKAYRDTIVQIYKGDAWTVDFQNHPVEARKQINAWVAKVTRNLISEVVNPQAQSKETLKVVANAIYFKGEWRQPFDKEHTVDHRKFHLLDGSPVKAFFMRRLRLHEEQIACHDGFKVLKLPYKAVDESLPGFRWKQLASLPKFSMCVFLPDARDGLPSLLSRMTSRPEFLHEHLPTSLVPVGDFRLPRFKLTFQSSIVDVLKSLGLRLPFEPDTKDLTEKMEGAQLYVDDVIHKAVIEVNEAGSEAAAYTESDDDMGFSLFGDEPPPPKPVDFVADHPFAFFIIEETTGTIVFSGHVLDPSKEE
ncbi:hypothetical protein QYE76_007538 [Lolium multiflorum]|uniref:Serpin domain-containing protein n=1 Tax=Lolium multiflorum TaxID=4521 RepID=A0AAD8QF02_LOLMU|nr:hypothetical protein QYE76_007538 [Lolium multiflorum]